MGDKPTFLEALNNLLTGHGVPRSNPLWDELERATRDSQTTPLIEGIQGESTEPIKLYRDPRANDVDAAFGAQQNRYQGLNVIDITPQRLSATAFNCTISQQKLNDKIGYEADNDSITAGGVKIKTWRTFQLANAGNFLKIEFLPSKRNFTDSRSQLTGPQNLHDDHTFAAGTLLNGINPDNLIADPTHDIVTTGFIHREASRQILVQFDDPNGAIFIAKDGEVFLNPFQTIFVSFKASCPRFSVIFGNNCSIESPSDSRTMNANLAMGPGHGLWNNPSQHCVPFCFSVDRAFMTSNTTQIQVNNNNTNSITLIEQVNNFTNVTTSKVFRGLALGWITNLEIAGVYTTNNQNPSTIWAIQVQDSTGALLKTLCTGTVMASTGAGLLDAARFIIERNFSTPRRFTLRPGDKLVFVVNNRSGSTLLYGYSIEGYAYGRLDGGQNAADTLGNKLVLDTITENPFPLDYEVCSN